MMKVRKKEVNKREGFYLKGNRIVLESAFSKIAFSFIVLMFGVVIALAVMDVSSGR